jgi:ribosomal protein S12 methylthiotransferase accessory factor
MGRPLVAAARLAAALGVTRVARVTGLERAGVEVACAVRPGGHVLQVSNGKGEQWAAAEAGALLEAAELWASERPAPARLVHASWRELGTGARGVWALEGLIAAPPLGGPDVRRAWAAAEVLSGPARGSEVLVPASALFCPPQTGPWLGPAAHRWTSNGLGASAGAEEALLHALLEACERDGLARALPEGFTARSLRGRVLSPRALARQAPRTGALAERLASVGLRAVLLDLHPSLGRGAPWLPVPLAGALLLDEDQHGPIPLTAGYACRLTRDDALHAALLEAAQSRLTDVHGAREDIAAASPAGSEDARALSRAARAARPGEGYRIGYRSAPHDLDGLLAAIGGGPEGLGVAALRLDPPGFPVAVVRVVAPGLLVSGLL